MGWFGKSRIECTLALRLIKLQDDNRDSHERVYGQDDFGGGQEHEAKFSHELIGGAAAFEGMKLFEDHQRKEGMTECAIIRQKY